LVKYPWNLEDHPKPPSWFTISIWIGLREQVAGKPHRKHGKIMENPVF
jgi:hypothetical protein